MLHIIRNKPSKQSSHLKPVSHAWLSGTAKLASDLDPAHRMEKKVDDVALLSFWREITNRGVNEGVRGGEAAAKHANLRLQMLQRLLLPLSASLHLACPDAARHAAPAVEGRFTTHVHCTKWVMFCAWLQQHRICIHSHEF